MLSASQRAAYARDGFLMLEDFVPEAECDALKARATELVQGFDPGPVRTVFSTADQAHARDAYFRESGQAIRFFFEDDARTLNKIGHALHDLDPVFDRVSRAPRMKALVEALDVARPLLLQSMYLFKQPLVGGEVDWHQDATFLHTDPISVVGLWIALDDATTDNGCLVALPGAHRGPLRRCFTRDGAMRALDDTPWPDIEPVALEARRGTLIVLDGLLPHASAANRSPHPRHAYSLHIIDADARYTDDNWLQRPSLPLRGFT